LKALNFYSSVYHGNLMAGEKKCTIRLGTKTDKYAEGDIVWVTHGNRFEVRKRIFTAVIDRVRVKSLTELTMEDIRGESPDMKSVEDALSFLKEIYDRDIFNDDTVTVVYFSEIKS